MLEAVKLFVCHIRGLFIGLYPVFLPTTFNIARREAESSRFFPKLRVKLVCPLLQGFLASVSCARVELHMCPQGPVHWDHV